MLLTTKVDRPVFVRREAVVSVRLDPSGNGTVIQLSTGAEFTVVGNPNEIAARAGLLEGE